MDPNSRLVCYARVSTDDQDLALQVDAFKKLKAHDDNIHVEKKSGANDKRPGLELALKDLRAGDTFVVWKLDRMGRSPPMLYRTLERVLAKGCGFLCITQHIDIGTAVGRLLFGILSAVAGFERDLISERTAAGLAVLKARAGKDWKWGPDVIMTPKKIALAGKLLNSRTKVKGTNRKLWTGPTVAKKLGVSTASIYANWKAAPHGKFIRRRKTT